MVKLLVVLFAATASCGTPCSTVKATRCNGSVVELCGSNLKWQRVLDCDQVKAIKPGAPTNWTCLEAEKGCTCVPEGVK